MTPIDRQKYMDASEVERLRLCCQGRAAADLREGKITGPLRWMIVDSALMLGARVSELAAIKVGDFDLKRCGLTITRRKRRKPIKETLALPKDFIDHIIEYLDWRKSLGHTIKPETPFFSGKRGPLTAYGLQQSWKKSVQAAGLPKSLSIHCARHTLAVALLKKTKNLRQVQKQLGHSTPAITANFYADVSFEDMQNGLTGIYDTKPKQPENK